MTQSTGADAPTEDEKTVTIEEACRRWGLDPGVHSTSIAEFMGQEGPWTEKEFAELNRRMDSLAPEDLFPGYAAVAGKGGPHGPLCECGDLTDEELAAAEELASTLAKALGLKSPEKLPGEPLEAILTELEKVQKLVDAYGLATGHIGTAVTYMNTNPMEASARINAETTKARAAYQTLREIFQRVEVTLPLIRGERATDAEGLPIWFLPASVEPSAGWLTTAQAESPGENWRAVYVR